MCCFCLFFYRISGILVIELIGLAVTVRPIMGNQSFDYSFFSFVSENENACRICF